MQCNLLDNPWLTYSWLIFDCAIEFCRLHVAYRNTTHSIFCIDLYALHVTRERRSARSRCCVTLRYITPPHGVEKCMHSTRHVCIYDASLPARGIGDGVDLINAIHAGKRTLSTLSYTRSRHAWLLFTSGQSLGVDSPLQPAAGRRETAHWSDLVLILFSWRLSRPRSAKRAKWLRLLMGSSRTSVNYTTVVHAPKDRMTLLTSAADDERRSNNRVSFISARLMGMSTVNDIADTLDH